MDYIKTLSIYMLARSHKGCQIEKIKASKSVDESSTTRKRARHRIDGVASGKNMVKPSTLFQLMLVIAVYNAFAGASKTIISTKYVRLLFTR